MTDLLALAERLEFSAEGRPGGLCQEAAAALREAHAALTWVSPLRQRAEAAEAEVERLKSICAEWTDKALNYHAEVERLRGLLRGIFNGLSDHDQAYWLEELPGLNAELGEKHD